MNGHGEKLQSGDQAQKLREQQLRKQQETIRARQQSEQVSKKRQQQLEEKESQNKPRLEQTDGRTRLSITKKPSSFEQMKIDARRKAESDAVSPYDQATGPSKIDNRNKIIPTPDLETKGKQTGYGKVQLDLPEKNTGKTVPGEAPNKQGKSASDIDGKTQKLDYKFNPEIIRLSQEEAERKKVAKPKDGVGSAFNSSTTIQEEGERFLKQLSPDKRKALSDPNTIIYLKAYRSRPGSSDYNKKLAGESAEAFKNWLVENAGVHPDCVRIKVFGEAHGERMRKAENKDDHTDRVILAEIYPNAKLDADKEKDTHDKKSEKIERKKLTEKQVVQKAKDVLKNSPPKNDRVKQRLTRLMDKLSNHKIDDSYIPGQLIFYRDRPGERPHLDEIIQHARPKVKEIVESYDLRHKGKGNYERIPASNKVLASRLESLDADIASGPQTVQKLKGIQIKTSSKWLIEVNDWIVKKQRDKDSILNAYAE
jgi:hypothetical protein